MKIIGFNLIKILIERKEKLSNQLKVTQNINIKDVLNEKIVVSKEDALKIKFNFSINYSEDSAKLEFEGFVIIMPEKDELKKFLREWKDKKIPDEFRTPLFNFIMNKCNVKAIFLEDEMILPLHFPLPKIYPNERKD